MWCERALLLVTAFVAAVGLGLLGFAFDDALRGSADGRSAKGSVATQASILRAAADAAQSTDELVILSNRGPVNWVEKDGLLVPNRAGGGLATGLAPLVEGNPNVKWIASAVDGADRRAAELGLETPDFNTRAVLLDPKVYDLAYNEVANQWLWFVAHGFWNGVKKPRFKGEWRDAWGAFRELNESFLRVTADEAPEGATVLVQDYHLGLLGEMLRRERPDLKTAHFTHTPFAGPDDMRRLPVDVHDEILEGMAGFGAVGFHTDRWATRYVQSSDEIIGRSAETFVAPLGIDPASIRGVVESAEGVKWTGDIERRVGDRMIIARTDRIELSKNILSGFEAYERMLELHPELHDKVSFVASIFPSREGVDDYRKYAEQVRKKARQINKRFGRDGWEPIVLYDDVNNHARGMAALSLADVVLINPVRDGLNLVAKELSVVNDKNASLVLSRETGYFDELRAAGAQDAVYGINPFDLDETANALYRALTASPEERATRASKLLEIVESRGPREWLDDQVNAAN